MFINIIYNTPLWVWFLLAFLIRVGISTLKQRKISTTRLILIPSLFLVWGIYSFTIKIPINLSTILLFIGFFIFGFILLFLIKNFEKNKATYDSHTKILTLPGERKTLILILVAFITKYVLSVLLHTHFSAWENFIIFFTSMQGLLSGSFWGNIAPVLLLVLKERKN